jgi:hypothetical protein
MVCPWFDLKTTETVFSGLASKPVATVFFDLASKLVATIFPNLGLKTGRFGLLIGPQNHRGDFLVWVSKPTELRFIGCTTKPTRGRRCGTRVEI